MTKLKYQVIVFDWDGTLMDSDRRIVSCLKEAAGSVGVPLLADSAYRFQIGKSLTTVLKTLYPQATDLMVSVMESVYRWQFVEANETPMLPFDGMADLLASLRKAGYVLAIATGKGRAGLNHVLHETGVAGYFAVTKSGEETASKPDPLMLRQIMDELGVEASQVVMVGDSIFDMEMAKALGVDRVAMTHGVHGHADLSVYEPCLMCEDLHQLGDWLLSGNR